MLPKSQIPVSYAQGGPSILNVNVWKRERFITDSHEEMGVSYPKNPKVTESFQQVPLFIYYYYYYFFKQVPLKAKGEGWAWLVVADFSVSDSLFLRSGHGQVVMFL